MSNFNAIWAVSKTLQNLLLKQMQTDPQFSKEIPVSLESPKAIRAATSTVSESSVSIWLYRVVRNEFLLNRQPPRPSADRVAHLGIPINLYYLITPMHADPEMQQVILGKVLQVFHDHALLRGSDLEASLSDSIEELRLLLETLSLEELTRVWGALFEPYQLSVSYSVQVITIDSALEPIKVVPVEARHSQ
jgi:hypothetical protein